jgi:4-hydroxybenzoate polyprenyltransferase
MSQTIHNLTHTARAWALSTHPVPSVTVATLVTFFAAMSGAPLGGVALVFGAMLTNQLGIGLGNDWRDATRDEADGRPGKPLATGVITRSHALIVAVALGLVSLGLSAALGPLALGLQVIMLGAGWWYNLHAKFHWSSPVSYLLGFGLLPAFALTAHPEPQVPNAWVLVVAGLLGVTAHFANALPDLAHDASHGIRGMPQLLGPQWSGTVLLTGVITAASVIAIFAEQTPMLLRYGTLAAALTLATLATVMAFRPTPPRIIFPIVMLVAALCVVGIGFSV